MNFRRGFQRVYAVLTVAWIGILLFALPSHRLKFWIPDIDYDAMAEYARAHPKPPAGFTIISPFDATPDVPSFVGAGRLEKSRHVQLDCISRVAIGELVTRVDD